YGAGVMMKNYFLIVLSIFAAIAPIHSRDANFFVFSETFDDGFSMANSEVWQGGAVLSNAPAEVKKADLPHFENDTPFIKLNASKKGATEFTLSEIEAPVDSVMSFRYRTEISVKAGQLFNVYVDEDRKASFEGVNSSWLKATIPLSAGRHSIKFETLNAKGAFVTNGYNAVFLDDVTIVHDVGVELLLFPRGTQDTFVNAEGLYKLRFTTKTLRADGSVRDDNGNVSFSASGGTLDGNGFWTPPGEGTFTVSAALGDLKAVSGRITVHPEDYLKKSYTYSGTGKTYQGYTGKRDDAPAIEARDSLRITNPQYAVFEADGFFLLEGSVNKPKSQNYARVAVTKIDSAGAPPAGAPGGKKQASKTPKLESWYIVKNNFSQRIWLPFGSGEYKVEIFPFDSVSLTKPPKGEGALRGGSYSEDPLVLTVFNTREENFVDGDARWIYPSFYVQSDNFIVTNLLNGITFEKAGEAEKARAVHDYIVSTLTYDSASFSNSGRSRKMDAVSVIENVTGVCEGYANLSAALLRAAGIPVKIVAARSIGHAWNNVYIDDAWKFYDATWDDPVPDRGPGVVDYTYFLLDSLSGGDNRHRGQGVPLIGDAD
ncbi:MAG: transglutaminase-like domain-containing protein, partial [Spirochaetaceae bacterium]|nr:transglutaminase-like domain-containing protein [Spirochaetaceae bacterium]